jgi:hypothetical protein
MLLGEALLQAGVISKADLQKALETQTHNTHLSFGDIITKLFAVPRHVVESHYINLAISPFINEWLYKQLTKKSLSDGLPAENIIAGIALTIPVFSRYEGETISFERRADGMYQESSSLTKIEKITVIVEPLVITTTRQQQIIFHHVHLAVSLRDKGIRPDNPGFLPEARLRLLKALKEKN